MNKRIPALLLLVFLMTALEAIAQDPVLTSGNFGLTNIGAGRSGPPGWYYIQYLQVYRAHLRKNAQGNRDDGRPLRNSIASIHQVAFISKIKVLGGNFALNALVPLQKATTTQGEAQSTNPNAVGDFLFGPYIQWYDQKIFGTDVFYRFGINLVSPTGAYSHKYDINPGGHEFRIFPHFEFTLIPAEHLAISIKNNRYMYFRKMGSPERAATAYNLNYALEYHLNKSITIDAVGYYLTQFGQDSFAGNDQYYRENYAIKDTRDDE